MEAVLLLDSAASALVPDGLPPAELVGAVGYIVVLALLFPFGAHRLYLVWTRLRAGSGRPRGSPGSGRAGGDAGDGARHDVAEGGGTERFPAADLERPLPTVTVQIPVYNEANVVARAVDAACRLDWPADRLEVQVLDDSTDATARIAARRVEAWRRRGVDAHHVRRDGREGYKAGALAEGVRRARGDYFLVLDADFVAPEDLLRRLVPAFRDPEVGFVQAAWAHTNEEESWLTRAQALLLDGHFAVEHEARHRAGLFFNFNGTAGMWRRACLEDVGGWSGATLTEDLELSYRAQMAGWRGVYLDDVRVPGELPPTLRALEVQQERWTRGGLQTARRLLPDVWRSDQPLKVKLEATSHLLGHLLHPLTLLLGVALAWPGRLGGAAALVPGWVHGLAVTFAVLPFLVYYGVAARMRGRGLLASVPRILQAVALGIGLGPPLTAAAWRGATDDHSGAFRRTPKTGAGRRGLFRYGLPRRPLRSAVRAVLGLGLAVASVRLAAVGGVAACAFTTLFASGYLVTALEGWSGDRDAARPADGAATRREAVGDEEAAARVTA